MFQRSFRTVILLALVLGGFATNVQAQFLTNVTLNKSTYLTYETVEATVSIQNRSGSDVVMGGPNGLAWLAFDVVNPAGNQVPTVKINTDESIIFKAGATISRKVLLTDTYAFSDYGMYTVAASIYHPPSQQYFISNRARAQFVDARPLDIPNLSFGVPTGLPGAGQIRKYTISVLRDTERSYMYVRLLEEKTGLKLATFSLGTCILVTEPQVTVDRENKLHILFMAAPHIYAHVCVDTQGKVIKRAYHKEIKSDRPELVVLNDQTIGVTGGVPYDPSAPVVDAKPQGRSIKQRPPGL
ncbi:MAG: hypothetical protein ACAI34_20885 [Verrucomicrobium sp.]|nr:hypothetical protein [Verrucomicrobium sp.]